MIAVRMLLVILFALLCMEIKAQDSLIITDSLHSYGIMPKGFQPNAKLHITQIIDTLQVGK